MDAALQTYNKALTKAAAIHSKDHLSLIVSSMAELQLEMGEKQAAIQNLKNAKVAANKTEDKAFQVEVETLLSKLLAE